MLWSLTHKKAIVLGTRQYKEIANAPIMKELIIMGGQFTSE